METLPLKSSSENVAVKPPLKDSQCRSRKEQCQGARSLLCRRPLAISEQLWVSGNPVDDRWCDCPCKFFTLKWQLIWKHPVIIGERYSKSPLEITKRETVFIPGMVLGLFWHLRKLGCLQWRNRKEKSVLVQRLLVPVPLHTQQ